MVLLIFSALLWVKAYSDTRVFNATARFEGAIVYHEHHKEIYKGDQLLRSQIIYTDPSGKVIGEQDADFSSSLALPQFSLKDFREEHLQGLKHEEGKLMIYYQDKKKRFSRELFWPEEKEDWVTPPGLSHFIGNHLPTLLKEDKWPLKLVIPGRLDVYDFELRLKKQSKGQAEFELKIKSWFLRIFTPRLRFIYDLKNRRLISYEGLSPLRDEDGDMMSVDILYDYSN